MELLEDKSPIVDASVGCDSMDGNVFVVVADGSFSAVAFCLTHFVDFFADAFLDFLLILSEVVLDLSTEDEFVVSTFGSSLIFSFVRFFI